MKREDIYVEVKNKKKSKHYKAVLKALGEKIYKYYWIDNYLGTQDKLMFCDGSWYVGFSISKTKVTIKQAIKIILAEQDRKPLLISQDGFDLFEDSKYHCVKNIHEEKGWEYCFKNKLKPSHFVITDSEVCKAFKHKENALKWIEEQNELLNRKDELQRVNEARNLNCQ